MPSGLFTNLPFIEAITALANRLAMPKPEFLRLDAANRSRAFTMARIADQTLLENIHDELAIAINDGDTAAEFRTRIEELQERSGWTGTSPWHYRVVYDQNLGMAYSAGRVQQGRDLGLRVLRYLPSISANPRPEHEAYYNNLYRMAPGSPVPPIDFGCNCGWEWVLDDELEALGVNPSELPVFAPPVPKSGFVWSATDYFDLRAVVASSEHAAVSEDCTLVACAAIEVVPPVVVDWFEAAVDAASTLAKAKFERLMGWMERITGETSVPHAALRAIEQRWADAIFPLRDDDEPELMHQATMAALLLGRADTVEAMGSKL